VITGERLPLAAGTEPDGTWDSPSLAFSPDGKRLAAGGTDRSVKVWDVATGQPPLTLRDHTGPITSVSFGPDGQRLAAGSQDGTVILWDLARGQPVMTLRCVHTQPVWGVAFSPDGQRLVSGSHDRTVKLWDAVTRQEILTLPTPSIRVFALAFSRDGRQLAVGGQSADTARAESVVVVWDARTLTPEFEEQHEARSLVAFLFAKPLSPEGVRARLQEHPSLQAPVRERALAFAERYVERASVLNNTSRAVVKHPGAARAAYHRALKQAETACRLVPHEGPNQTTLGMAQYRIGNYAEAVTTLLQAEKINAAVPKGPTPADLAFLAMAQYQLAQKEQAQSTLKRLRETMQQAHWRDNEEAKGFLREAECVVKDGPVQPAR
jgi:hypothetical protein